MNNDSKKTDENKSMFFYSSMVIDHIQYNIVITVKTNIELSNYYELT